MEKKGCALSEIHNRIPISLYGHEFELIEYRLAWGEDRVYFLDATGQLQRLPASWTNVVAEDPFVVVAAGVTIYRISNWCQGVFVTVFVLIICLFFSKQLQFTALLVTYFLSVGLYQNG